MPDPIDVSGPIAALEAQIRQLSPGGRVQPQDIDRVRDARNKLQLLQRQQSNQRQQGEAGANQDRITAARDEAYGLARAGIGETDPVDAEILSALRGRATGDDVPFNEATTNAMFTQQAEMAAQRATNARGRLGGGSITDPAVQAQLRASQAQSDASMQRARLGVDTQANLANYDARGQALGQASNQNQQMTLNQRDVENRLMNMLMQEAETPRADLPQQGGTTTTRSAPQPQRQQGGSGYNPAPWRQSPGGLVVAPNQPGRVYNVGTGSLGQTSGSVATNGGQGVPTNTVRTQMPERSQGWTASGSQGTVTNGGRLQPWNAPGRAMLPDYLQRPQ